VGLFETLTERFGLAPFQPDAFRLKVEGTAEGWGHPVLVIEFAEIVVSHDVPAWKLDYYEDLWWLCDATELTHLRLWIVNRYGEKRCVLDDYPVASG
jgi:hypothetical protein